MMTEKSGHKKHRGLMAIAALKFVNGFGLLALGFGALHFLNGDLPKEFAHWMELLRADPHNRYPVVAGRETFQRGRPPAAPVERRHVFSTRCCFCPRERDSRWQNAGRNI